METNKKTKGMDDRISISFNSQIKKCLVEQLENEKSNISKYLRSKINYIIDNNKEIHIKSISKKQLTFPNYKRDTNIVIKIDKKEKEKFKDLIKEGTISIYINLKLAEFLVEVCDKQKYKKEIQALNDNILRYVNKYEDEIKIVYEVNIKEKRMDIYLESILKEKYNEMLNKLENLDYSTHLRYFITKAIKENKPINSKKIVNGNRNSKLTIIVNEKEYRDFKKLFEKKSSISSYFRDIIIEELTKSGYNIHLLI